VRTWNLTIGQLGGRSSETLSHPIDMNNNVWSTILSHCLYCVVLIFITTTTLTKRTNFIDYAIKLVPIRNSNY
jgi:hypothetical protein